MAATVGLFRTVADSTLLEQNDTAVVAVAVADDVVDVGVVAVAADAAVVDVVALWDNHSGLALGRAASRCSGRSSKALLSNSNRQMILLKMDSTHHQVYCLAE
jgi:hypothetical protein